jgi:hypothetical protein
VRNRASSSISGLDLAICDNGSRRVHCEVALEDGDTRKDPLLGFRQQIIAPIDRRAQRLMARRCRTPALGQDGEAIIEASGEASDAKHIDLSRG